MRDVATHGRYGSWLDPGQRAVLLNREVRCISRVVVAPQWRGLGLAVRLVRAALDQPTTPITEAIAAMGRVSPFFEKAGMTAYPRPPHCFDDRLTTAMQSIGIQPIDLAVLPRVWHQIQSLPRTQYHWLVRELKRWARKNGARSGGVHDTPDDHLQLAQNRLLVEPVYYFKQHKTQSPQPATKHEQPASQPAA